MGVFDTIHVPCPGCREDVELQSKGAEYPRLRDYTEQTCPPAVAIYVDKDEVTCQSCGRSFVVRVRVGAVSIRLEPPPNEHSDDETAE